MGAEYYELKTYMNSVELTGSLREDVFRFLHRFRCPATAEHVWRVGDEARRIAMLTGADPAAAEQAGYLHDISAIFPNEARLTVAQELGIEVLPEEERFPLIVHQKISAVMAEAWFRIDNPQVISAVGCHTTLKRGASLLDKVLFVADKIEWDQQGIPPYLAAITDGLDVSIDHAAFAYLDYMWERRESLKVLHPWLADAHQELTDILRRGNLRTHVQ